MEEVEENQTVLLKDELPQLKALIYASREREELEARGSDGSDGVGL